MSQVKKFINDPKQICDEAIAGYLDAEKAIFHRVGDKNVLVVNDLKKDKIGILAGGGLAAEPLFPGYVGVNMADCAVIGNVNAAPSPFDILSGTQAIHQGKGVLYIYNNYCGDVMTFDMAKELAVDEGITIEDVCVYDNVGSAPIEKMTERKGNMGAIYVIKIAGGASTMVDNLQHLKAIVERARDNTRSLIVAGGSGHYLESGDQMFDLPPDVIEYGVGLHGEPGLFRDKMEPVDRVVEKVMGILLSDLNCEKGDEVVAMVNSMGATSITELFIINQKLNKILKETAISVHHNDIGFFYTSQDMIGFSITLMKLDEELKSCFNVPANSFSYKV
jgi:phosphoenolpyruvate---glycerone phosphotransferase subunit DhaK